MRNIEFFQDALRREFGRGELGIGFLPYSGGAFFVKELINPEIPLQFQMRPMIERIAQRMGNRRCPGWEFCESIRLARAKSFGHAVRPHRPPFIMIALQPDFEQVFELPILSDVSRRQVEMVIEYWFLFGEIVIEALGSAGLQQEIFVNEFHGKW